MTTLLAVNNYYYYRGGAETVFLEHNKMFQALGWQVVPFAMHHPQNLPTPWAAYFVDEIEFGSDYSLAQKVRRIPKTIYSIEARHRLARLLDRIKPDICHAHNIYHHISPSILGLLRDRRIPSVMTLHDLKIACPAYNMVGPDGICERCKGGRLHNVLVHRCIKGSAALSAVVLAESVLHRTLGSYRECVSRFVVPSRFYLEKFVEWGFSREQFTHVRNFVDAEGYTPRFSPGKSFLYFGRLSHEKGLATLLRAAADARVSLQIAGTGPQQEELNLLAEELRADITFLGYLTGASLHEAVRNARAVILPSEWYENAPISILEAYALGKPVAGARVGGIPELIKEGITGLTFASGDVESLSGVLRDLAGRSDADLEQMGREGQTWVAAEFTAREYQHRILETYRELGVDVPRTPAADN